MNAKKAKRLRYNAKLDYIREMDEWLNAKPPMWRLISFAKWRDRQPKNPFSTIAISKHDSTITITKHERKVN